MPGSLETICSFYSGPSSVGLPGSFSCAENPRQLYCRLVSYAFFSPCLPRGVLISRKMAKRQPATGGLGEISNGTLWSLNLGAFILLLLFFLRAECFFSSPSVSVMWHLDAQTFGVMQKWKRIYRNREREGPMWNQPQPFPRHIGFDLLKNHAPRLYFWLIWYCLFVAVWALLFVSKLSFLLVSLADLLGLRIRWRVPSLSGRALRTEGLLLLCDVGVLAWVACN